MSRRRRNPEDEIEEDDTEEIGEETISNAIQGAIMQAQEDGIFEDNNNGVSIPDANVRGSMQSLGYLTNDVGFALQIGGISSRQRRLFLITIQEDMRHR